MSVKIAMLTADFTVAVDKSIGVAGQKLIVAGFAALKLAQAQQINQSAYGHKPPYETTVDGRERASLTAVNPDGGKIVFDFDIYSEVIKSVVEAALAALRDASPVVSGAYKAGHTIFVNGEAVEEVPDALKPSDKVMIANPVPYARRLEIGKTMAGRSFVISVPNRIYERVAKNVLSQRFGNQVKITFEYAELPGALTVIRGQRKSHAGRKIMSPAIIIGALKS